MCTLEYNEQHSSDIDVAPSASLHSCSLSKKPVLLDSPSCKTVCATPPGKSACMGSHDGDNVGNVRLHVVEKYLETVFKHADLYGLHGNARCFVDLGVSILI